jgi:hypothetical protein
LPDIRVIVGWLLRILVFSAGIAALYAGILLYPDEQGGAQNQLEEWWVIFDDQQKVALSKAALFMRAMVTLTGRLLDGIFGRKLISLRALTVLAYLSLASLCVVLATGHREYWVVAGLFIFLGVLSFRFVLARISVVGILALIFWGFSYLGSNEGKMRGTWIVSHADLSVSIVLMGGILSDIAFVTWTRRLLRWTEQFTLAAACLVVVVANAALGILLFLAPVVWGNRPFVPPSDFEGGTVLALFLIIGATNGLAFLISLLVTSVAFLLLLHRMLWPTAARLLYVVAPTKTQKVLLVMAGTALLTVALGKPLSDGLTEALKGLSSGG